VDLREGKCTCPDATYTLPDDGACKHERRARFALGREPIPQKTLVAVDVDENLGANTPGPVITAADGGVVKDEGRGDGYEAVDLYGDEYTVTEIADRAQETANMDPAALASVETELAGYVKGLEDCVEDAEEKRAVVLKGLQQSFLAAWRVARQS